MTKKKMIYALNMFCGLFKVYFQEKTSKDY